MKTVTLVDVDPRGENEANLSELARKGKIVLPEYAVQSLSIYKIISGESINFDGDAYRVLESKGIISRLVQDTAAGPDMLFVLPSSSSKMLGFIRLVILRSGENVIYSIKVSKPRVLDRGLDKLYEEINIDFDNEKPIIIDGEVWQLSPNGKTPELVQLL